VREEKLSFLVFLLVRREKRIQTKTDKRKEILKEKRGAESNKGSVSLSPCAIDGEECTGRIIRAVDAPRL
jgi:hypothetical protein